MIKDGRLKNSLNSKLDELAYDLLLIIEIYENAQDLSHKKIEESHAKMKELDDNGYFHDLNETDKKIYEEANDTFMKFGLHFEPITLHSLFVSSFSFFEYYLEGVTELMEFYFKGEIKVSDITKKNSEIDQKRRYLNLVHHLKTASVDNHNWKEILSFYKIRNLIVHNHNRFDENKGKKESIEFLKRFDARIIREVAFEIKNKEFLIWFKGVVVQYGSELTGDIFNSQ